MWRFASHALAESLGPENSPKPLPADTDCSDDEISSCTSRDEGLECPICWESFNIVENVPYVLWCGHTLCKNCVLGLQSAVMKFPTLPVQLPLFISCPWCHFLSFRLVYKGILKFPRKNFFLLWLIESMHGNHTKYNHLIREAVSSSSSGLSLGNAAHRHQSHLKRAHQISRPDNSSVGSGEEQDETYLNMGIFNSFLRKSLVFFVHLTAKFPLVIIFLLILVYAVPASAAILALYVLVTLLFAVPSFLILYFSYPSLNWLVREIIN